MSTEETKTCIVVLNAEDGRKLDEAIEAIYVSATKADIPNILEKLAKEFEISASCLEDVLYFEEVTYIEWQK